MSPYSKTSIDWREQNKEAVEQWKKKYQEIIAQSRQEWWSTEQLETEIGASLGDQELRDIWFFARWYIGSHRSPLANFFGETMKELKNFGTLEPARKRRIMKSIATTRRKSNENR